MRTLTALLALAAALLAAAPVHAKPADTGAAKKILIDSVAIPTVAGRGKVPELAAYYAGVLKAAGYADSDIVITPMGETATFAATLQGTTKEKPILLLGHMDVVEADAKDWTRDPFVPVEENGYIFGRGSEDNKFDVAMMVATMAQLKKDGFKPKRSIILLLSGDEETSMTTTRALAAKYKGAELALNGDGGGGLIGEDGKAKYYGLQAGEKTYADFTLEVTNPGGHSSRPSPTNAIVQLSNALAKVGAYHFKPQQNELTKVGMPIVADQVGGAIGAALKTFAAIPADAAAIATITADSRICRPDRYHLRPDAGQRRSRRKRPAAARDRQYQLPHLPWRAGRGGARRTRTGDRRPRGGSEARSRRERERRLAATPRCDGGGDEGGPCALPGPADHPVDERRGDRQLSFPHAGRPELWRRGPVFEGERQLRARAQRAGAGRCHSPARWHIGTACCATWRNR